MTGNEQTGHTHFRVYTLVIYRIGVRPVSYTHLPALLLYRRIAQTLRIVCQFDLLYILDCHITDVYKRQMLCSALNCLQVTLYYCKGIKIIWQAIKIGYILSLVK